MRKVISAECSSAANTQRRICARAGRFPAVLAYCTESESVFIGETGLHYPNTASSKMADAF
jgi:hypothetical protein